MTRRRAPWCFAAVFGLALLPRAASADDPAYLEERAPEVVFTAAIRAKAVELEHDPVRIYEFVRNELEYEPYYGLLRGPDGALAARAGNDYDQNALLASLLRASDIPVRFVRGRIDVPAHDAVAWLGTSTVEVAAGVLALTEPPSYPKSTATDLDGPGPASTTLQRVQVWVEAKIPLSRYRGTGLGSAVDPVTHQISRDRRGEAWVPLDASFKRRRVQPGIELPIEPPPGGAAVALAFDYDAYYSKVDARSPSEIYEEQVRRWLATHPDPAIRGRPLSDVPVRGGLEVERPGVIPTALPYALLPLPTGSGAFVPAGPGPHRDARLALLHTATPASYDPDDGSPSGVNRQFLHWAALHLCEETLDGDQCRAAASVGSGAGYLLGYDGPTADLDRQRVALSFPPAGSAALPSNGYLGVSCPQAPSLQVEPTIWVDGVPTAGPVRAACVSTGASGLELARYTVLAESHAPGFGDANALDSYHAAQVGGVYVLALDTGSGSPGRTRSAYEALASASELPVHSTDPSRFPVALESGASGEAFVDNAPRNGQKDAGEQYLAQHFPAQEALTGGLLHLATRRFAERGRQHERFYLSLHHRLPVPRASVGMTSAGLRTRYLLDVPVGIQPSGLVIDLQGVGRINLRFDSAALLPVDEHLRLLLHDYSAEEHLVWEDVAGLEATSSVRGLQITSAMGIPVLEVGGGNVGSILDGSQCSAPIFLFRHDGLWCSQITGLLQHVGCSGSNLGQLTLDQVAAYVTDPTWIKYLGTCEDIDFTTYCELKRRWGPANTAWRALQWDSHPSCRAGGTATGSTRLTISKKSNYSYRDWQGYVYLESDESSIGAIIKPLGGDFLGGGFGHRSSLFQSQTGSVTLGGYDDLAHLLTRPTATVQSVFSSAGLGSTYNPSWNAPLLQTYDRKTEVFQLNSPILTSPMSLMGDPVSIATGNLFHQETDLEIAGRGGMPLRLVRTYNSRVDHDGALGAGWIHTYDQHLRFEPATAERPEPRAIWVAEDGSETMFRQEGGAFEAPKWSHDALSAVSATQYRVETKAGMVYRFDRPTASAPRARLHSVTDRNGNVVSATYDASGRLERVSEPGGMALWFAYDGAGKLERIENRLPGDALARSWRFAVRSGDLVGVCDAVQVASSGGCQPDASISASNKPTRYTYSSGSAIAKLNHNLVSVELPETHAGTPGKTDGGRRRTTFAYNANDTVASHTDALGRTTRFTYNVFQKRTWMHHPDGSVESFRYDAQGNLVYHESARGIARSAEFASETNHRIAEWDGLGHETRAEYDAEGNVTRRVDRLGAEERWTYGPFGLPLTHVDRRGHLQRFEHDARGNLLRVWAEVGGAVVLLRENRYDAFGNVIESVEHANPDRSSPKRTRYEYDPTGSAVVRVVDAAGVETRLERDALRRAVAASYRREAPGRPAPETVVDRTEYDLLDRVTARVDPTGTRRTIAYTADGLVARQATQPFNEAAARVDEERIYDAAHQLVVVGDALGHPTTIAYDLRERPIETRSPLGHVTRRSYDADGNTIGVIDPTGAVTSHAYDPENRLVETVDPLGRTSRVEHNAEGWVVKRFDPGSSGPRLVYEALEFDEEGNVLRARDAAGHETVATFDELGRRTSVTLAAELAAGSVAALDVQATMTVAYDLQGRVVAKTDPNGHTTSVRYDALGRPVEITDPLGRAEQRRYDERGRLAETIDAADHRVRFEYDARGLLVRRSGSTPAGRVLDDRYTYDFFGRQVGARAAALTRRFEYDALDRPVTVSDALFGTARRVYDADGRIVQAVYPSGPLGFPGQEVVAAYGHDARGAVTSVTDSVDGAMAAGRWSLQYDAAGRLVRTTSTGGLDRKVSYTPEGWLSALETALPGGGSETFAYLAHDALGNPGAVLSAEGTTQLAYDARSRLVAVTYPGSSGSACFTDEPGGGHGPRSECFAYDKAGNRRRHRMASGADLAYELDASDALTRIVTHGSGAVVATYAHDAAGRRIQRAQPGVPSATTTYAYDPLGRLARVEAAAGTWTDLTYDALGHRYQQSDSVLGPSLYLGEWVEHRDGAPVRLLHGPGVDDVLAEITGGEVRALVADGGGNVIHAAAAGSVTYTRRWEAFGARRSEAGLTSLAQRLVRGFAGRPEEGLATGLVNLRSRHYEPATGRFLQPDPMGIASTQLYAYAESNPFVYSDPTGWDAVARVARVASARTPAASTVNCPGCHLGSPYDPYRATNPEAFVAFGVMSRAAAFVPLVGAAFWPSAASRAVMTAGSPIASGAFGDAAGGIMVPATRGVPSVGALSNAEARVFYSSRLAEIPRLDAGLARSGASLRDRALNAFRLRYDAKLEARGLMADRILAESLPPPQSLSDLVRRAYEGGLRGEDVWRSILESSTRSSKAVNRALGQ